MNQGRVWSVMAWMVIVAGTLLVGGCGPGMLLPGDNVKSIEPNDTFSEAQPVDADLLKSVKITGDLFSDDCDVYLLGSFEAGTTISVNLRSANGILGGDVSIALFDKDQNVAYLDGYVSAELMSEEVFSHTVRKDGKYYLAICKTEDFGLGALTYDLRVMVGSTLAPLPTGQVVYLDFNGGSGVRIGGVRLGDLQPFSEIDLNYNPQIMAEDIANLIRTDFNGYQVEILSSYNQPAPSGPHSTVYITASEGDYFGLADKVDWYDADPEDNAVVYAGLLARPQISQGRFVQAVANVISHEVGHLLGLIHTDNNSELMDQATPTSLLELDQNFGRAVLAADEFPIGFQDALELLAFAVGLL